MASTASLEHGRDLGALAVVSDKVVEEVEESDEKAHAHESRRHSVASSSRTIQDDNSKEQQDVEVLQASTTNSEPWSVFTTPQKRFIVLMVALASFLSPLSANIYFPALVRILKYGRHRAFLDAWQVPSVQETC